MTIGWSFIENFENDSQPYKHTSRNVSEQKRCTTNEKYDSNTNSCVPCESGTYQSADNHTSMNCKIKDNLILNGYNNPRSEQNWKSFGSNKKSLDECRQYVLDEKNENKAEYDERILMVCHRKSQQNCWYVRNNNTDDNRTVNAFYNTSDNYRMTCIDADGNPTACDISNVNCNGMDNYYYSASDNLCKPHTTCGTGQSLSGATGTSPGTCSWDPVNCVGDWGNWGGCSKTCGGGKQSRTYTVTTSAKHGGAACPRTNGAVEQQDCNTHSCPVNCSGYWGGWSGWGACDRPCAGGIRKSTKTYKVTTSAAHGGEGCPHSKGEQRQKQQSCHTGSCVGLFNQSESEFHWHTEMERHHTTLYDCAKRCAWNNNCKGFMHDSNNGIKPCGCSCMLFSDGGYRGSTNDCSKTKRRPGRGGGTICTQRVQSYRKK